MERQNSGVFDFGDEDTDFSKFNFQDHDANSDKFYLALKHVIERRGGCGTCLSCQSVMEQWTPSELKKAKSNSFGWLLCDKWYDRSDENFPGLNPCDKK